MSNEELINALRLHAEENPEAKLLNDTADALEAAEKRIAELQEPIEKQIVDYCHKRCLVIVSKELLQRMESTFAQLPTIDAVEVKHGEWIIDGMNEYELSYGCVGYEPIYRCSKCGITTESYLRTERPIMPEDADFPNYCPNCGAKMDGKEQNDE